MTPQDRAALREAASKATPGPWEVIPDGDWGCEVVQKGRAYPVCMCEQDDGEVADANARYIAQAHPAAVLALLDECERMREAHQRIVDRGCETFHINPVGGPNIVVEGGDRFAHERDVRALVAVSRAALGDGA